MVLHRVFVCFGPLWEMVQWYYTVYLSVTVRCGRWYNGLTPCICLLQSAVGDGTMVLHRVLVCYSPLWEIIQWSYVVYLSVTVRCGR